MKGNLSILFSSLLAVGLMTQGFQCSSPEFTGAKVYIQQKNYKEAARLLEIETQKNPTNEEAWFLLGEIKSDMGDYEGMNAAFASVSKLSNKHNTEIHFYRYKNWAEHVNVGISYVQKASSDSMIYYDKAIEEYNKSIIIWPDTSLTYKYLAAAYNGKGDIDNAILNLKKAWELGHDKEMYKMAGRMYVKRGLDLKSVFDSTNADKLRLQKNLSEIKKGSYKSDVLHAFGAPDNQTKDKKNTKFIYNQYKMTVVLDGDVVISKTYNYDLKIDSTKFYEAVGEFNKAIDIFEVVKKTDPKDNENLNLLLQAYVEANRIEEATKTFRLAIDNDPSNKVNHYILGVLHRTIHNYDAAIAEFKETLRIDPEYSDAIFDIGATYYNWGVEMKKAAQEKGDETTEFKQKFREAFPYFEQVIEIKKKTAEEAVSNTGGDWHSQVSRQDAQIWETLGTIYALLGQSDKAMKQLDETDKIRKVGK